MSHGYFKKDQDAGYFVVVHSSYVGNWEEGDGSREHRVVLKTKDETEAVNRYVGLSEQLGDMSLTEDDVTLHWPTSHRCEYTEEVPWGEKFCRCGRRQPEAPYKDSEIPF